jgi:hypothetical protein
MINLERIFKGLELVGALAVASQFVSMPNEQLDELKRQLGIDDVKQIEPKKEKHEEPHKKEELEHKEHKGEHNTDKQASGKEKEFDFSSLSDEQKIKIMEFLKTMS